LTLNAPHRQGVDGGSLASDPALWYRMRSESQKTLVDILSLPQTRPCSVLPGIDK